MPSCLRRLVPPASMKTNNNVVGGKLDRRYANYANYLRGFANHMSSNGAAFTRLDQNERHSGNVRSGDWICSPSPEHTGDSTGW